MTTHSTTLWTRARAIAALTLAVSMAVGVVPVRADAGQSEEPPREAQRPGRHKNLGLTLGTIAGGILGVWAGWAALGDEDSYGHRGPGTFFAVWSLCAVGGGLAGYAAGGGFSHERTELALERGREAVRHARATSGEDVSLTSLRLSSMPGLDADDLLIAEATPAILTAAAR